MKIVTPRSRYFCRSAGVVSVPIAMRMPLPSSCSATFCMHASTVLSGVVGMEVERELEVVRAPGHVGDARSDEAGDVGHRLDGLDLNAEQDGLVPPGGVLAPRGRRGAGAQTQSVGPAPAPPPDRAVVGEVDGVLYGRRLHDFGNERAGDAEVEEAADLVGVARVRDA